MDFKYLVNARLYVMGHPTILDKTECLVNHRDYWAKDPLYHCTFLNSRNAYGYIEEKYLFCKTAFIFNDDLKDIIKS